MRRVGWLCLFALLCAASVEAKCGPLLLRIHGETSVRAGRRQILVTIAPEPGRSNPMVLLEGDRFEADVYYDPFRSHSAVFGYNCTKRPEKVTVALLENGKEVDKRELAFNRDFVADGEGGYVLRAKLRLGR